MTSEQQHHYASEARRAHSLKANNIIRKARAGKIDDTTKAALIAESQTQTDAEVAKIYGINVSEGVTAQA